MSNYTVSVTSVLKPVDINECADEGSNDCSHRCVNSVGSFHCGCNIGFVLQEDGYTCNGKIVLRVLIFFFHFDETYTIANVTVIETIISNSRYQ